ncbi:uncharacterized protein EDB93DRAFT_1105813 [Suillus bovinus]|nr:uncharacterized protein EDB93DRAFT_1105813 [Suillus bovinus]KAG2140892.1 hypothetical protein EDB93DRAFT_1105813 [Suillus bovinus]
MIQTALIGLLNTHASLKPAQVTVCGGRTRLASGPASSRSILDTGYCHTAAEHVTTWFIILSFSFSLVLISMLVSSIFSSSSLLLRSSIIRIPLSHDYWELEGNFSAKKVHPGDLKTAAANEAMGGLFVHHLLCLPEPCQQLLTCAGCLRMIFVVLGMAAAAAWWGEFGGPPSHYNLKDYQELEDNFSAKKAHPDFVVLDNYYYIVNHLHHHDQMIDLIWHKLFSHQVSALADEQKIALRVVVCVSPTVLPRSEAGYYERTNH